MNSNKDATGQEILAFHEGKDSYEVVERDDGFVGLSGGAKNYFAEYKNWPKHEKQAIKFARGKVLDIGAGAGRVALYLQEKGYKVTAIDDSPVAIKVCKKRGVKNAKVISIEEINNFKPATFDTIIMFGNNFGLFSSFKKAKKILKVMHKITQPNAVIIAESNHPYKTKDPDHISYHKLNKRRGRMPGQLRIRIRFKKYASKWFDYLLVSPNEMKDILNGTGWKIKKLISSDKSTYIAIIEKK